jgi:hypothetical protein
MNPARRSTASIIALFAALVCFIVALALSTNEILHSGNQTAWVDGGLVAVTAGLLLRWWA